MSEERGHERVFGRALELFDRWAEEEAGGYAGEVSWEEFKRSLDDERRRSGARLLFPEG